MKGSPYSVIVCDLFHAHEPDHETWIPGFPTRELAIEYARRRTWTSVDQMREPGLSPQEIRRRWLAMGEDCRVVGPEGVVYMARAELDTFLAQPPPPERRDWVGLYRALLPQDFALTYAWAAASLPPPHHFEYEITVTSPQQGHLRFWPDYPREAPPWDIPFHPHLTACILVHNWIRASLPFPADWTSASSERLGGETGFLQVAFGGRHVHLNVHELPDEERLPLHQALQAIVPAHLWERCFARRRRYINATYPDAEGDQQEAS